MSSPSSSEETLSWRQEVFQDAARIWAEPSPAVKHLMSALGTEPGLAAAALFRFSARLHRAGHPYFAAVTARINLALHGCQIHPRATIGPGLRMPHPNGIVVGWGVRVGADLTLFQNVTLGARDLQGGPYPRVGDGVIIFPNSVVAGGVILGSRCRVGAGSVVLHDVAEGSTVAGSPAVPLTARNERAGSSGGGGR